MLAHTHMHALKCLQFYYAVLGDKPVNLLMYKDPQAGSRRVPSLDYQEVACAVPSSDVFTLKDDNLWVGPQQVGSQILYTVPEP